MKDKNINVTLLFLTVLLLFVPQAFYGESAVKSQITDFAAEMIEEASSHFKDDKVTVAIIELEDLSDLTKEENLGEIISSILMTEFVASKQFVLVERSKLDKVLEELNLSKTGFVDSRSAHQIGLLLAADLILCGTTSELGTYFDINVRLIDVERSSVITALLLELKQSEYFGSDGRPVTPRLIKDRIQKNIDAIYVALYYYGIKYKKGFRIKYPKALSALVPEFLHKLPDPIKGKWVYDKKNGRVKNSAYPTIEPSVEFPKVQPALDMAKKNVILSRLRNIHISIQMYTAEYGEPPASLEVLVKHGALDSIPDPVDGEWKYDSKTGEISHSIVGKLGYN